MNSDTKKSIKVCISGAHCTGKTTLVNALKESGQLNDFIFRSNLLRGLKEMGIPINEIGDTTTQLYVMTKFYEFLHTPGNAILDRCALDGMAYTMFFYKDMPFAMQQVFEGLFEQMIRKYDAICYVVPELPLIDDGVRSVDKNFYEQVIQNFEILISEFEIPVHYISGTVEERKQQVLNIISSLKEKNNS
jgi:nicotinamide riboside kinase